MLKATYVLLIVFDGQFKTIKGLTFSRLPRLIRVIWIVEYRF